MCSESNLVLSCAAATGRRGRASPDAEVALARAARAAEAQASDLLMQVPACRALLEEASRRPRRTYAEAQERMAEAVACLRARAERAPRLRGTLQQVQALLEEAARQHWTLALTARRIVFGEARKLPGNYLALEDLEQEGHIGLLSAARRFDPDRGLRFSTYARWWVRAAMTRAIETTGRMVRLPGGAVEQTRRLRSVIADARQAGVSWTIEDVAELAGVELERAHELLRQFDAVPFSSLGDGTAEGADVELDAHMARAFEGWPDAMEAAALGVDAQRLDEALGTLDRRQRQVLEKHFGLGSDPLTLADIGRDLGCSRERARQLEVAALEQMRRVLSPQPRRASP